MTSDQSLQHYLAIMPSGRHGQVEAGTNLLDACRQLGVELESICGGRQTCGKCQIVIEEGRFAKHGISSSPSHTTPLTLREQEYLHQNSIHGRRLACATCLTGDLLITVPVESLAHRQIIAKMATDRPVHLRPAVRQYYLEVAPATLGDPRGDLERLLAAFSEQWDISSLTIDPLILPELQPALAGSQGAVTVTLWAGGEIISILPGYEESLYGLAVDVGSTTVVAHLCNLHTGEVVATAADMNPQVSFGEDLMSRISYATSEPQGLVRLHRAIIHTLNELAQRAAHSAGIGRLKIVDMVVVGNTVMHHLLLGIHPQPLGEAPFALAVSGPVDIKARDLSLRLHPAARIHCLPLIAGHVGADNVGVMIAEQPYRQEQVTLIVDVGTNAEIVLGDRQEVYVASSPTGPAFEGAQITHGQRAAPGAIERVRIDPRTLEPSIKVIGDDSWLPSENEGQEGTPPLATGICGSGIIEAIAEMFLASIIDLNGHFIPGSATRSSRVEHGKVGWSYRLVDRQHSATGSDILITQADVRAIQLAKAALYAGAKLLMKHRGVTRVERVVLAGAFGSYLSPRHAMILGMIPDCALENVSAVGNAAGDGARIALLDFEKRVEAAEIARQVHYIETPLEGSFQDEFVAALALPHARDEFNTLVDILPQMARPRQRPRRQERPPTRSQETA